MKQYDEDNFPFATPMGRVKGFDFSKAVIIKDSRIIIESDDKKEGLRSNSLLEFCFEGFGDPKVFYLISKLNKANSFMDLTEEEGDLLVETLRNSIRRMKVWQTGHAEVTKRIEEEE